MKLELTDLCKRYPNGAMGVDGVSIAVEENQMVVLLGPSGCGKTTLLRLISGLEAPDRGSIVLDGNDITTWEPKRRDVAMVFQNYALYPHMTIRENLEFALKSRGMPKHDRRSAVNWAANLLGLSDYLGRKPAQLSGGQRQRVALGRAIVRKPKLYLFDEPLSNLDAELRMRMRGEILSLHRRVSATSIYVTHDQVEAMSLADKVFIMNEGTIVSRGTPSDLYKNPPNLFTARFLGFPAMNLIEGIIDEERCFVSSNGLKVKAEHLSLKPASIEVVMGVRPEDITIADDDQVTGRIISMENMGWNSLLLVESQCHDRFRVIAQGQFRVGENLRLRLPADKLLFFDKKSGKRIQPPSP